MMSNMPEIQDTMYQGPEIEFDQVHGQIANAIIKEIFAQRRLLPGEREKDGKHCAEAAPHFHKVLKAIEKNEPVSLVLPAFPAKSPSRQKTLSHLPDHGEELAFMNLSRLCERIEELYAPGANMIICSDGRVFADIVRIPDQDVTDYNNEMKRHVQQLGLKHISFFDLDDVYPNVKDFAMLREELMVVHGEALESLQQRCRTEVAAGEMYRGIIRFLFEDFCGLDEFKGLSRNAVQGHARLAAYRVIQRSNAWGRLLATRLPDAVRLSIHPQFRVSEKIGINLIDASDCWATPWHSVVLKRQDRVSLVARREAEAMNAALIFKNGRPSYFQVQE